VTDDADDRAVDGSVEAVLFDLDDTLVTYRRSPGAVLELAFAEAGYEQFFPVEAYYDRFDEYLARTETLADLRRACFADIAASVGRSPAEGEAVAAAFDRLRDPTNVDPLPGARRVLDELADDYRLGLVTNGSPSAQEPKLAGADLADAFDARVFAGSDTAPKPDREPFDRAVSALGVDPAQAVMVGDSLSTDVAGARGVGMRTVYLSDDGATTDGTGSSVVPDHRIESLAEVLDLLRGR
jgi:HAD superfamily hydrolase (TIGR01549 family)